MTSIFTVLSHKEVFPLASYLIALAAVDDRHYKAALWLGHYPY
jgi:hypothetical protein